MNAYIRFKLGLTENKPTIKPYEEALWAELNDVNAVPINISITLLYALHTRWHSAILNLPAEAWNRTVFHPESKKEMSCVLPAGFLCMARKASRCTYYFSRERKGW